MSKTYYQKSQKPFKIRQLTIKFSIQMKNVINFQPKRFDKITFTKNMKNCFRNLLTKTTLWRVAKSNSPMKNLKM